MAWDLCPQGVMDLQILDLKFSGNLPRPENCRRTILRTLITSGGHRTRWPVPGRSQNVDKSGQGNCETGKPAASGYKPAK